LTSVRVNRLTVDRGNPVRSAISPLPCVSTPGRKALMISMPLSSDRLPSTPPAYLRICATSILPAISTQWN